ncbi:MAG: hypothetical protein Alpg2KO_23460 [Alphaproteobacteria bacterium]
MCIILRETMADPKTPADAQKPADAKPADTASSATPPPAAPAAAQASSDKPGWQVFNWFRRSRRVTPTLCDTCPAKRKKRPWYKRPFRLLLIGFLAFQIGGGILAWNSLAPQDPPVSVQRIAETVKSDHSEYLDELQARFGQARPDLRIAYIDRDKIALMAGLNRTKNPMADQIAAHKIDIEDQTGARLSRLLLLQLDMLADEDLLSALPMFDDDWVATGSELPTRRLAVITPAWQITDGLGAAAMLSYFPSYAIETLGRTPGQIDVSAMEMQRFIDYHETTHAVDDEYVWNLSGGSGIERDYLTHKAEMLADVHAALLNAQDGYMDSATKIASVRAIGSLIAGPAIAKDDNYGGSIYYTAPGLYEAQRVIDRLGQARLKNMSLDQTMELAYRIVEQNALTFGAFKKLHDWHQNGARDAVTYILDIKSGRADLPEDPDVRAAVQTALDEFDRTFSMDRILEPPAADAPFNDFQREVAWRNLVAEAERRGGSTRDFAEVVTEFKDRTRAALAEGREVRAVDQALLEHVDEYLADYTWMGNNMTTGRDGTPQQYEANPLSTPPVPNGSGAGI